VLSERADTERDAMRMCVFQCSHCYIDGPLRSGPVIMDIDSRPDVADR
jgi:hypothetical protein